MKNRSTNSATKKKAQNQFAKRFYVYSPNTSLRGYNFSVKCGCPLCELIKASVTLYEADLAEKTA